MDIKFLSHEQINKTAWDDALAVCKNYLPYAHSWYLDVVSPGWEALATEDYSYIFPLTWKSKFLIKYLHQPYFTQQLGLFSPHVIDDTIFNRFTQKIDHYIRFAEINVNHANTFATAGFSSAVRNNLELELGHPYTTIKELFADNVKRNIAKAEKNNLFFSKEISLQHVITLFKKNKGFELENFKASHYRMLEKLHDVLVQKNKCFTAGALKDGQLLAGALFVVTPGRIIFLFSGNSEGGKQTGAMHFLIDKVIKAYSNTPCIFDFEGSNDAGLSRFYKSFGSVENVYLHLKKNSLPYLLRLIKK